jgi:hypothetical protein
MSEQENTRKEVRAFLVKVTYQMVVIANKESDAVETAKTNAVEELQNQMAGPLLPTIKGERVFLESVPNEWVNALPYIAPNVNVNEDKTCKELLNE